MNPTHVQSSVQRETAEWFRSLPPARADDMEGLWKGSGYPSDHPLDGVLENLCWFGKRFHREGRADALLFGGETGKLVAVDPVYFPIKWAIRLARIGLTASARNLFTFVRPRLRARGTTATIGLRVDNGVMTAAMVYDRQPIVDYFRQIDERTLVGKMVVGGDPRFYFFKLEKVGD